MLQPVELGVAKCRTGIIEWQQYSYQCCCHPLPVVLSLCPRGNRSYPAFVSNRADRMPTPSRDSRARTTVQPSDTMPVEYFANDVRFIGILFYSLFDALELIWCDICRIYD